MQDPLPHIQRPQTTNGIYGYEIFKDQKRREFIRSKAEATDKAAKEIQSLAEAARKEKANRPFVHKNWCPFGKSGVPLAKIESTEGFDPSDDKPLVVGKPVTTNGLYGFESMKKILQDEHHQKQKKAREDRAEKKKRKDAMNRSAATEEANLLASWKMAGSKSNTGLLESEKSILPKLKVLDEPNTENHVYGYAVHKQIIEKKQKMLEFNEKMRLRKIELLNKERSLM